MHHFNCSRILHIFNKNHCANKRIVQFLHSNQSIVTLHYTEEKILMNCQTIQSLHLQHNEWSHWKKLCIWSSYSTRKLTWNSYSTHNYALCMPFNFAKFQSLSKKSPKCNIRSRNIFSASTESQIIRWMHCITVMAFLSKCSDFRALQAKCNLQQQSSVWNLGNFKPSVKGNSASGIHDEYQGNHSLFYIKYQHRKPTLYPFVHAQLHLDKYCHIHCSSAISNRAANEYIYCLHIYPQPSYDQLPATSIIVDPFNSVEISVRPIDMSCNKIQRQPFRTNNLLAMNKWQSACSNQRSPFYPGCVSKSSKEHEPSKETLRNSKYKE